MMTVEKLRKSGCKVYVDHYRNYDVMGNPLSNGGETYVTVIVDNDSTNQGRGVTGKAVCSNLDSYNKRLGVRIALGRALKQLGMPTK